MADEPAEVTAWLAVLLKAVESDPDKYKELLAKVEFLEGLGLSQDDAAQVAGKHVIPSMEH